MVLSTGGLPEGATAETLTPWILRAGARIYYGGIKGGASGLIGRLLARGLVTRGESASDRRYQDIGLTNAGVSRVPQLAALADENDEGFFGVLSRSDRKTLTMLLKKTAAMHHLTQMPIE